MTLSNALQITQITLMCCDSRAASVDLTYSGM